MKTEYLIHALDRHTDEAIDHLQHIISLLRGRSIEADFFYGMINRIKSERKRVCRQIIRKEIK